MTQPCQHETDWGALSEWQRRIDEKLDAILAQVTATNGRVGRLEKWKLVLATALATMIVVGGEPGPLPALAAKLIEFLGR